MNRPTMNTDVPSLCPEPVDKHLEALLGNIVTHLSGSLIGMAKIASSVILFHPFSATISDQRFRFAGAAG